MCVCRLLAFCFCISQTTKWKRKKGRNRRSLASGAAQEIASRLKKASVVVVGRGDWVSKRRRTTTASTAAANAHTNSPHWMASGRQALSHWQSSLGCCWALVYRYHYANDNEPLCSACRWLPVLPAPFLLFLHSFCWWFASCRMKAEKGKNRFELICLSMNMAMV